ncbi:thiamine phosphate synthase [uncultured Sphingomonas sp.]|uniref:thiamine phosphate synthase n=1 Tax=uncultured Sphingomonas sp. TaxID=158754 RepID=UPI0035CC38E4
MRPRYPARWLMTDERMGDALLPTLRRLPPGSGVVFRHYLLGDRDRRALFGRVRRIARARRLVLVVARPDRVGRSDGVHGTAKGTGVRTWPAHDRREAIAGARAGADLLFVSPIFPTRSHPEARAIGPARAAVIGRGSGIGMVALGGMTERRFRQLRGLGFVGWAAIDALTNPLPPSRESASGR